VPRAHKKLPWSRRRFYEQRLQPMSRHRSPQLYAAAPHASQNPVDEDRSTSLARHRPLRRTEIYLAAAATPPTEKRLDLKP